MTDGWAFVQRILKQMLPAAPDGSRFADAYKPYTAQRRFVFYALDGLQKLCPGNVSAYCADGCVDILMTELETKDGPKAAGYLKQLYEEGFQKAKITKKNGYYRAHFDRTSCNYHNDSPEVSLRL